MAKVRSHSRRSKKGKMARVRSHTRNIRPGRARASVRINQMHPEIAKSNAAHLFDMVYDSTAQDIKTDGRVAVKDFGTFKVKRTKAKPARMGRNPFTGENVMLKAKPAGKKVKFIPSKKLKLMV